MSMPTGFIENTRETISTDNLLTALSQARYMHERLLVAYYSNTEGGREYHMRGAREAMRKAAEAMGYALAYLPKQDDQLPTDWLEDGNEDERNGLVIHNVAS